MFNFKSIQDFDKHINLSIPNYENLSNVFSGITCAFAQPESSVVDIGCSTGKLTTRIMEYNNEISSASNYIGVEVAEGFFDDLINRKSELNDKYPDTSVEFIFDDIRNYEFENCSLITSLFTLQFMPKKDRFSVIQNIYDGLNEGGGFIFAEKIDCENSRIQDMLTFNYYDFKREKFTTDDIMNKEQTLRHMLKPNTWNEIHYMVEDAGFKTVEQFWRNHNFLGAIAIK